MNKPPLLSPWQRAKAALRDLDAEAGSRAALGIVLGVSKQAAYGWKVLPEHHLRRAVELFGSKAEDLRPDLSAFQVRQAMKPAALKSA